MKNYLIPPDYVVLTKFLVTDTLAYSQYRNDDKIINGKGGLYIAHILNKIETFIDEELGGRFKSLTVYSYTNAGLLTRQLDLPPNNACFAENGKLVNVHLCTCGKFSHWGHITAV